MGRWRELAKAGGDEPDFGGDFGGEEGEATPALAAGGRERGSFAGDAVLTVGERDEAEAGRGRRPKQRRAKSDVGQEARQDCLAGIRLGCGEDVRELGGKYAMP